MSEDPLDRGRLSGIIERVQRHFQGGILCWTAGTHDFPRLASRWHDTLMDEHFSQEAFDHQLAALLISLQGSCCIYQGDELGLHQAEIPRERMQDPFGIRGYPHVLGRDGCRTPMPWRIEEHEGGFTKAPEAWLPLPHDHRRLAVEAQEGDPQSLLNKYRRLIHWRRHQQALTSGDLQLLPSDDPVLAFARRAPGQTLLFAFNFSAQPVYQTLERWPACTQADELDFQVRRFEQTVEIPGFGVFIGVCQPSAPTSGR
jgi:alpha-glucosidase